MNIVVLGDKYEKGKKSKGCQGLALYNSKTRYIDYQNKILASTIVDNNIIYIYGIGEKNFLSYYKKNLKINNIKIIYNQNYETKNDVYSVCLCKNLLKLDSGIVILFGNTEINKQTIKRLQKVEQSCVVEKKTGYSSIGCVHNEGIIENIGLDLQTKLDSIYYVAKKDIPLFLRIIEDKDNHNKFIFEIFNIMSNNTTIGLIN